MQSWPTTDVPVLARPTLAGTLRLHDTPTDGPLAIAPQGTARLYVCGITPYDATHLGHAATYLAFDLLVRVWRDQGLDVRYAQNVTDIDDPLLERAARDGVDWAGLAEQQVELFREDMTALRVLPPTAYVGAVEVIPGIADAVVRLLEEGVAYRVDEDVYCSVGAISHFGEVAGLDRPTMTALSAERGGDPLRPGKKDPLDSLLWLAARPGEPSWPSPLGPGRPGWHVECACIALDHLGVTFDVQGGGSDLAYPHHEHSAATASALSGVWPFARAYVHAGMLGLDGEKMSKSKGNLVFVSRLRREGVEPAAIRLALQGQHYRGDREWTPAALTGAQARLATWRAAVARTAGPDGTVLLAAVRAALLDDLDAPAAIAAVDAWCAGTGDDKTAPALVHHTVDALLGIDLTLASCADQPTS